MPLLQPELDRVTSSIDVCRRCLSPSSFEEAWHSGQELDLDAAQDIAKGIGSKMSRLGR